jgi:hypothetical protein
MRGHTDSTTLLNRLDADELRQHLDRLDEERAAVLVLLRAARARERARQRHQQREVSHASR